MTAKATEKPARLQISTRNKKPRKSESVKDRPRTVAELSLSIDAGRLDGRTVASRKMTEAREIINADAKGASRALIVDALAQGVAVLTAISCELSRPGAKVLDDSGNLTPIIEALFRSQDNLRRTVSTLIKLDGKGAAASAQDGKGGADLADIIIEAGRDADTDCDC